MLVTLHCRKLEKLPGGFPAFVQGHHPDRHKKKTYEVQPLGWDFMTGKKDRKCHTLADNWQLMLWWVIVFLNQKFLLEKGRRKPGHGEV